MVGVMLMISTVIFPPFGHPTYDAATGVGALLMSAKFVIAKTTGGYFGLTAENNPLLNAWSLSVEAQFYLVFPALIAFGWFLAKRRWLLRFAPTPSMLRPNRQPAKLYEGWKAGSPLPTA